MRKLFIPVVLAAALSAGSAGAQIVTKLSGIQPLEHPSSYAEKFFAEQVSILTNGAIKVENYHNTQLGDAVANVQSIRNGTIGFTVVSASNLNQVVPAMDMLSLPFIFKNESHFWWYLAQPEAENFVKALEEKGIKKIAYIDSGSRNLFTQKAAVMQAGALTQAYMRGAWKISELKDLQELKAKFTQIIEPDKAPFMEAVKPLVMSEAKRLNVEKTVNFILDSGKKF